MNATYTVPPLPGGCRLVLASNSPRRRELIAMIAPDCRCATPPNVDETYPSTLPPHDVAPYLSRLKAAACPAGELAAGEVYVTADTVVIAGGRILGKPHSHEEAVEMLTLLSGRVHEVVTGVTLTRSDSSMTTFSDTTRVHFAPLSSAEIEAYVSAFRPFDKAGAYGIQEWIGAIGITGIEGCFYNVMGLPLAALYLRLKQLEGHNQC